MSVNGNRINYWLIECVLFNVPPKHISFVRRRRHYRVKGGTILALAGRLRSLSRGGSRLFEQWWILIIWVRMDFDHLSRGGSWSFEQGWILIILIEQGWIFIVPKLAVTRGLGFCGLGHRTRLCRQARGTNRPVGRNFQRGGGSSTRIASRAPRGRESQKPWGIWSKLLQSSNFQAFQ